MANPHPAITLTLSSAQSLEMQVIISSKPNDFTSRTREFIRDELACAGGGRKARAAVRSVRTVETKVHTSVLVHITRHNAHFPNMHGICM